MKCAWTWGQSFTPGIPVFQYLAVGTAGLNVISSGMHYGWPSPSLPKLLRNDSHIPTTSDEGSWIAVLLLPGGLCGSILGVLLLDWIGRKCVILFTSIPFFAAWIMLAFSHSVPQLLAGRFIAGIGDGLVICSLPMYIGEISDPKVRGFLGSAAPVAYILGILLVNVIGSYASIPTTALISATLPVLLLLTFSWMPESPYWLIMKNKLEKAGQSLRVLRGTSDVEEDLSRLTHAVKEQTEATGRYLDVFTVKSNRRALYVMMVTRGVQQLSGSTAITFYAQIIFEESGDIISPTVGSIIYFSLQLVLSGLSSVIVDWIGRKPLLVISIAGSGTALLIEGCFLFIQNETPIDTRSFTVLPVVALITFVVMFGLGLQTIPVLMLGEVFPTNVKVFAICLSDMYFTVITAAVSKFFQVSKDAFGMHVPFFAFAGCCALGLVLTIGVVPETKGKTLEEIQEELKGHSLNA